MKTFDCIRKTVFQGTDAEKTIEIHSYNAKKLEKLNDKAFCKAIEKEEVPPRVNYKLKIGDYDVEVDFNHARGTDFTLSNMDYFESTKRRDMKLIMDSDVIPKIDICREDVIFRPDGIGEIWVSNPDTHGSAFSAELLNKIMDIKEPCGEHELSPILDDKFAQVDQSVIDLKTFVVDDNNMTFIQYSSKSYYSDLVYYKAIGPIDYLDSNGKTDCIFIPDMGVMLSGEDVYLKDFINEGSAEIDSGEVVKKMVECCVDRENVAISVDNNVVNVEKFDDVFQVNINNINDPDKSRTVTCETREDAIQVVENVTLNLVALKDAAWDDFKKLDDSEFKDLLKETDSSAAEIGKAREEEVIEIE